MDFLYFFNFNYNVMMDHCRFLNSS